jgi:hypothetical protein
MMGRQKIEGKNRTGTKNLSRHHSVLIALDRMMLVSFFTTDFLPAFVGVNLDLGCRRSPLQEPLPQCVENDSV